MTVLKFQKPAPAPKRKKRVVVSPKRENAKDIAKRIMKGKPPAKRFTFVPTLKGPNDVII